MLHSALPRAYLGAYLGAAAAGYFEDSPSLLHHHHHHHHPYVYTAQHQHDTYVAAQRAVFHAWTSGGTTTASTTSTQLPQAQLSSVQLLRATTPPCHALDLSLKPQPPTPQPPPPPPSTSPIEVDDEEDRRSREEARSQHSAESCSLGGSYYAPGRILLEPNVTAAAAVAAAAAAATVDENVVVDDQDSRSSSHYSGYHLLQSPGKCPSDLYYQQLPDHKIPVSPSYQQLLTPPPPPPLPSQHHLQSIHAPMTPPSTPSPPQQQCPSRRHKAPTSPAITPPAKDKLAPTATTQQPSRQKKKHARRLKFDEDTSSPVSGTVILGPDEALVTGDIDPAFNIVEVTEEARAELAKIENRLGPYQCKLCRQLHEDAFQLAQHRCSRIAHVEYRCPECDKRFSCPANLASHRRWHKPRPENNQTATSSPQSTHTQSQDNLACTRCDAKFARTAALRKHLAQQHPPEQNNNNDEHDEQQQQQQPGKDTTLAMEMA